MRVPRRLASMIGLVTTMVFLTIGGTLFANGSVYVGGAIIALGVYRSIVWMRQRYHDRLAGDV